MVCPPPHGMYVEATVLRMLDEGVLGELRHVIVRGLTPAHIDPDVPLHWRQSAEYSGLHTQQLGIMMEVAGRWFGYPVIVQARQATFVTERTLPDGSGLARLDDELLWCPTISNSVPWGNTLGFCNRYVVCQLKSYLDTLSRVSRWPLGYLADAKRAASHVHVRE